MNLKTIHTKDGRTLYKDLDTGHWVNKNNTAKILSDVREPQKEDQIAKAAETAEKLNEQSQKSAKPKLDYSNTPVKTVSDTEKEKLKADLKQAQVQRKEFLLANKEKLESELDYDDPVAKKYRSLSEAVAEREFEAHKVMPPVILDKDKWNGDLSVLSYENAVIPRKDMLSNKEMYLAIQSAAAGTSFSGSTFDTAVDALYKKDKSKAYAIFAKTREMLKEKYGEEITLYRVGTSATKKPTINMASTRKNAQQYADWYGEKITRQKVKVDDVLAVNINRLGKYEEFIVLQEK